MKLFWTESVVDKVVNKKYLCRKWNALSHHWRVPVQVPCADAGCSPGGRQALRPWLWIMPGLQKLGAISDALFRQTHWGSQSQDWVIGRCENVKRDFDSWVLNQYLLIDELKVVGCLSEWKHVSIFHQQLDMLIDFYQCNTDGLCLSVLCLSVFCLSVFCLSASFFLHMHRQKLHISILQRQRQTDRDLTAPVGTWWRHNSGW